MSRKTWHIILAGTAASMLAAGVVLIVTWKTFAGLVVCVLAVFTVLVMYLTSKEPCALDLGFYGAGLNANAAIQNSGTETVYNVTVKIPKSGSAFKSNRISLILADKSPNFLIGIEGLRKAADAAILENPNYSGAVSIPVRITYQTNARNKLLNCDDWELCLPVTVLSFRRKI